MSLEDRASRRERMYPITWLQFFRLGAVIFAMSVMLLRGFRQGLLDKFFWRPYLLLLFVALLCLVYIFISMRVRYVRPLADFQIWIDLIWVSCLIYLTGGVESNFVILYFGVIFAASLILTARSGLLITSFVVTFLAGITLVYFLSHHYKFPLPLVVRGKVLGTLRYEDYRDLLTFLLGQSAAFYAVFGLSSSLASRLKRVRIVTAGILQNMTDGVLAIDQTGQVVFLNSRAQEILGISSNWPGRRYQDLLKSERHKMVREALAREDYGRVEMEVEIPGEGKVPVALHTSLIFDDQGQRRGLIALFMDLSERRRREEAEERAERMALLAQMSASIAHELRNPLGVIRGSVQTLASGSAFVESDKDLVDLVVKESDRIDNLITDFLSFARMKPGILHRMDLAELLSEVGGFLKAHEKGGADRIHLEVQEPLFCRGSAQQLKQAFINLGVNALEAMDGKGSLEIRAKYAPWPDTVSGKADKAVQVDFVDEGPGLKHDMEDKVFEPFFTTKAKGTGLGLAIVKRIIGAHEGEVLAQNLPSGGAKFSVYLPAMENR